jgi:hypothetical protein
MSSIRKQISSRQNGALSRGPVTEEGKRRSSMNALRHGLLATHAVLDLEPKENFDILLEDHMQGLPPQDGVQLGLIEEMTTAQWRMRRLRAIENGLLNRAIRATSPDADGLSRIIDAYNSLADSRKFNNLSQYEGRLHRRYFRALTAFLAITRPQPEPENKKETNEPN